MTAELIRICDLAGRPRGSGFVADDRGTVLTSHEAVDGLARMVLHGPAPQERSWRAGASDVTALPELGLALVRSDGLGARPLPVAPRGVIAPGTYVRLSARGWRQARVLGPAEAAYPAADRLHLLPAALELAIGTDGRDALRLGGEACGGPVLDAGTGAVLAVLCTALQAEHRCGGFAVPLAAAAAADPGGPLAALLERNAATVPGHGADLNLAGALQLTGTTLGVALRALAAGGPEPVDRPALAAELDAFTAGDRPVLALVGRPGTGRTTALAALAVRRARGPRPAPTLWLRGADLRAGDTSLADAVARALAEAGRILEVPAAGPDRGPDPASACTSASASASASALASLVASAGRPLLVVLDGPEEMPPRLAGRAGPWTGATAAWLEATGARLAVAARPEHWESAGRLYPPRMLRTPARPARRLPPAVPVGDLTPGEAEQARARLGIPADAVAGADARHPLTLRLLAEIRAAGVTDGCPSRDEVFAAHLDLLCLRVAVRVSAAHPQPRRPGGGAEPDGAGVHGPGADRLAARVAGRVHEAARRCLGPGRGQLDRASFEELFPWRSGWASAVLTEGLLVPAGEGYRFAHEELADWVQAAHLDLPAALATLGRDVPRHRIGPVLEALRLLPPGERAAGLERLVALLDGAEGPEATWWAARLVGETLLVLPDATPYLPLLHGLATRLTGPEPGPRGTPEAHPSPTDSSWPGNSPAGASGPGGSPASHSWAGGCPTGASPSGASSADTSSAGAFRADNSSASSTPAGASPAGASPSGPSSSDTSWSGGSSASSSQADTSSAGASGAGGSSAGGSQADTSSVGAFWAGGSSASPSSAGASSADGSPAGAPSAGASGAGGSPAGASSSGPFPAGGSSAGGSPSGRSPAGPAPAGSVAYAGALGRTGPAGATGWAGAGGFGGPWIPAQGGASGAGGRQLRPEVAAGGTARVGGAGAPAGPGQGREDEGEFGAGFWSRVRVAEAERFELLRRLLPHDHRLLDAAARRLVRAPQLVQPLLCGWFRDERRLHGRPGATVATAAQALLHTNRSLAVDDLTEALVTAAHPRADELLAVLAEDEPSALSRAVDRWAHDERPGRRVAAAAYGPLTAPHVRTPADRELLRYAAQALLARPADASLHGSALGILLRDPQVRARYLPEALACFRDPGRGRRLPAAALVAALPVLPDPDSVFAALRERADGEVVRALAALTTPGLARRAADLVRDHLARHPQDAPHAAEFLERRLEQGLAAAPVLRPLVRDLLGSGPPPVRAALARVLAAPGTEPSYTLRGELAEELLREELDPSVLDAFLGALAAGAATGAPPDRTRDLLRRTGRQLLRAPGGPAVFERRTVELARAEPAFGALVARWLERAPQEAAALLGPSARRTVETLARSTCPGTSRSAPRNASPPDDADDGQRAPAWQS
ncbi:serine protease [Streptomyces sp. NBC_01264]|uniref:serine protease n=1 Tax=Streptomyces sp. NBC_01264 TaxID=2903804 RepID=UPI0022503C20|nr:serine protease [Streptomyces sp. NBC_01264]MCX4781397.1 serine protease [Streptomyces sp. NBC_01264]